MLRWNSTKSRPGLSRSKSTSSVRNIVPNFEHIDPAAAERDAHIAATLSFWRAWERSSAEMSPARGNSTKSGITRSDSVVSRGDGPELHRQHSVRFVGPCSVPKRTLGPRAADCRSGPSSDRIPINVLGNTENWSTSRASPDGKQHALGGMTGRYLDALEASEEYYTPEDDIASVPSSYRKLRKSNSLFVSPVQTNQAYFFNSDSPDRPRPQGVPPRFSSSKDNKENRPPPAPPQALRGPKSMSFLRPRREQMGSRTRSQQENDIAVQMARDKFREQVEQQQRLKSHPSLFFRSRKGRGEESFRGMRKSLRSSSNSSTTILPAPSSNSLHVPKDGLRNKARKVSKNLKHKLKTLFHLSKSEDSSPRMPDELAEVPKSSILQGEDGEQEMFTDLTVSHQTDECSVSQVPSRVPSLHAVPSREQVRSRQGSMESIKEGGEKQSDEKSRVTSWTSSGGNTVSTHNTWDWERQRLSVIKENGTHISSSSLNRPSLGSQNSYHGNTSATTLPGEPILPGPTVDSQRVYSALMKRLGETRQKEQQLKELRLRSVEDSKLHGTIPFRTSSAERGQECHGKATPRTIRFVQPEDDVFQDDPGSTTAKSETESESGSAENDNPFARETRGRQRSSTSATSASYVAYQPPVARDGQGSSPEKSHYIRGESEKSSKALSTRSSTFFASPRYHMFRTASPYRQALQERMREVQEAPQIQSPDDVTSISIPPLPPRCPSTRGSDRDPRLAYSESVYSVATIEGEMAGVNKDTNAMIESFPHRPGEGETPTVYLSPLAHRPTMKTNRIVSTASSVEWKTWLSANVSRMEDPVTEKENRELPVIEYAVPTMPKSFGHVREGAEVSDETDPMPQPVTYKPTGYMDNLPKSQTPLKSIEWNVPVSPLTTRTWETIKSSVTKPPTPNQNENEAPRERDHEQYMEFQEDTLPPFPRLKNDDHWGISTLPLDHPAFGSHDSLMLETVQRSVDRKMTHRTLPKMRSLNAISSSSPKKGTVEGEALAAARHLGRSQRYSALSGSTSSPGLTAATEKQFRTVDASIQANFGSPVSRKRKTAERQAELRTPGGRSRDGDSYKGDVTGVISPNDGDAQAVGSGQMVDLFLSSRRRRTDRNGDGSVFI